MWKQAEEDMKSGSTPTSWLHTPYLSVALQYEVVAADILKAKPGDLDELEESDHRRATEELSERSAVVVRQKAGLQAFEILLAVNGRSVAEQTYEEVIAVLKSTRPLTLEMKKVR